MPSFGNTHYHVTREHQIIQKAFINSRYGGDVEHAHCDLLYNASWKWGLENPNTVERLTGIKLDSEGRVLNPDHVLLRYLEQRIDALESKLT